MFANCCLHAHSVDRTDLRILASAYYRWASVTPVIIGDSDRVSAVSKIVFEP